jgi:hypothetical protein
VRPGDYLFRIASTLGVPLASLLSANGLTLTSVIHPGQQLTVPAASGGTAPTTPATTTPATPTTTPATTAPATTTPATTTPATASPPVPMSPAVVEDIIRDVWPDDLEGDAMNIVWRESRFQPTAQNSCCVGLFQIAYEVHKGWLPSIGVNSRDDLLDARTNARAAYTLYLMAGGWGPWALALK